jgi:hypothetical protein
MAFGIGDGSILPPLSRREDLDPGQWPVTIAISCAEQESHRAALRDAASELQIFLRYVESNRAEAMAGAQSALGVALSIEEIALSCSQSKVALSRDSRVDVYFFLILQSDENTFHLQAGETVAPSFVFAIQAIVYD